MKYRDIYFVFLVVLFGSVGCWSEEGLYNGSVCLLVKKAPSDQYVYLNNVPYGVNRLGENSLIEHLEACPENSSLFFHVFEGVWKNFGFSKTVDSRIQSLIQNEHFSGVVRVKHPELVDEKKTSLLQLGEPNEDCFKQNNVVFFVNGVKIPGVGSLAFSEAYRLLITKKVKRVALLFSSCRASSAGSVNARIWLWKEPVSMLMNQGIQVDSYSDAFNPWSERQAFDPLWRFLKGYKKEEESRKNRPSCSWKHETCIEHQKPL